MPDHAVFIDDVINGPALMLQNGDCYGGEEVGAQEDLGLPVGVEVAGDEAGLVDGTAQVVVRPYQVQRQLRESRGA